MRRSTFSKWLPWVIVAVLIFIVLPLWNAGDLQLSGGPRLGLIEIDRPIYSSRQIVKDLNYFEDRGDVDGIIIRLETPGGAVAASQEIFQKVRSIARGYKPVVASMGNVAASGGYYIALGADSIVANPGTATGSIGVIMGYPVISDLMAKLGVGYQQIRSGELKDSGSPFREVTAQDTAYFQALINNLFEQFVGDVAQMRKKPVEEIRKLATGQVYSGAQAYSLGLIDRLGTFEDAIYMAGHMTGIPGKPVLVEPPRPKRGLLDILFEDLNVKLPLGLTHPIPEYRLP
ncbi:MAG: signal peptide peptidase SppA [FCB group bacterium]|nr:signal peptide peptidase SppA [FCB group bacterium]